MTERQQMDDGRERSWVSRSEGGTGAPSWWCEGVILRSVRSIHALFLFADPSPSPFMEAISHYLISGRLLSSGEGRLRQRKDIVKRHFPECAIPHSLSFRSGRGWQDPWRDEHFLSAPGPGSKPLPHMHTSPTVLLPLSCLLQGLFPNGGEGEHERNC